MLTDVTVVRDVVFQQALVAEVRDADVDQAHDYAFQLDLIPAVAAVLQRFVQCFERGSDVAFLERIFRVFQRGFRRD